MDNPKETLFSAKSVLLFAVLVMMVLWVLFPGKKLLNELANKPTDGTTIHYLKALLDKSPKDKSLRLRLANELFELGLLKDSADTVKPLLMDTLLANDAQLLILKIQRRQYFDSPSESEKIILKKQFIETLAVFYPDMDSIETLETLAEWSQDLGAASLSARIYQHIVELLVTISDEDKQVFNLYLIFGIENAVAEAVKNAEYYALKQLAVLVSAHQLDEALLWAEKYRQQFNQSDALRQQAIKIAGFAGDANKARDWGRLSIINNHSLQNQIAREKAANEPENSLQWALQLLNQPPDKIDLTPLFIFASELALGLDQQTLARQLGLKRLKLEPDNIELIDQQVSYELAAQELESALKYAKKRVSLESKKTIEAQQQLAHIALWTGNPKISLEQWQQLYISTGNEKYLRDGVSLGKALFKYDVVAELYEKLSVRRALSDAELKDFYQVLQATGFASAGEKYFKRYIKKHPKHRQAWLYLVTTQALIGDYQQAAHTVQLIKNKFGMSHQLTKQQVVLLSKAGDFKGAWDLLNQTDVKIAADDSEFWQLYTKMAWITGHEQEAKMGYYNLFVHDAIDQGLVSRLLQLNNQAEDSDNQIDLLMLAFEKTKTPNYLLDAINLSLDLKQAKKTAKLLAIAEQNTEIFKKNPRYWLVKSTVARRVQQREQAKKYLLQALSLDPDSIYIRVSLLWHMIDYGSDNDLRQLLQLSISTANNHAELWQPIGAGFRRLGQPSQAISWYKRAVEQNPEDYLLLLAYADTLNESGEIKKAIKLKRFILTILRPKLIANLQTDEELGSEAFKQAYGLLIAHELGAETANSWFKWTERQNQKTQQVMFDEYRVTWFLAQNNREAARHHLIKNLHQRLHVPVWQQMAIAVIDNETETIEKLLKLPKGLSATDRMTGLTQLTRTAAALNQAKHHLNNAHPNKTASLRRQVADLSVQHTKGIAVSVNSENISTLDLWGVKTEIALSDGRSRYQLGYESVHYSSNNADLMISSQQKQENNLKLTWQYSQGHYQTWLQSEFSLRDDHDLYGAKAGLKRKIWQAWSAYIEASYNLASNESAVFKLLGAKDQLSLGLKGAITQRDYFALSLQARHYKNRDHYSLGTGYGVNVEMGYRVKFAQPAIDIKLYGHLSQSSLVDELPKDMQFALGNTQNIENVLSKRYRELGLNLKIYEGESRPFGFVERSFHYLLSSGTFISDPYTGLGLSVEAAVGTRLFEQDDLSLMGRYVDAQGGVNSEASKAIELRYSFRFD